METTGRRYDIDWLRVIAIGLLLIYHTAIAFQPWGIMIGFITNNESWDSLWIPMQMLNVWRIPLLFYVSGMGVYFAIQNRNWKQLITERSKRILIPFLLGYFVIVPLQTLLWLHTYHFPFSYVANPGHLWFLGNIFSYTLIFSGCFIYLKKKETGKIASGLKKNFSHPFSIILIIGIIVAEALLVNPGIYEMYALTWHGFFLGMLAFLLGFCMAFAGQPFLQLIKKWKWILLALALGLYLFRSLNAPAITPGYWLAVESVSWILAIFSLAHQYLNNSSNTLSYLSKAAYPIYIVHMAVLYIGSLLLFPLKISVYAKFFLLVAFTVLVSWLLYEFIIKRIKIFRLLFGIASK